MSMWDLIDSVKVINLDHRVDRWDSFVKSWDGIIPEGKLDRVSAVLGVELPDYLDAPWFRERTGERAQSWAGVAGCTLSHRRALESIVREGKGWSLILEDDAEYVPVLGLPLLVEELLSSDRASGIFYLGCQKLPPFAEQIAGGEHGIWSISGALTTHAYMVHVDTAKKLLEVLPTEKTVWEWIARYRAIDTWYFEWFRATLKLPVWACLPNMVTQAASISDISHHSVDHSIIREILPPPRSICSLLGGLWQLGEWVKRAKIRLNSIRTYQRALLRGFPGFRKKIR